MARIKFKMATNALQAQQIEEDSLDVSNEALDAAITHYAGKQSKKATILPEITPDGASMQLSKDYEIVRQLRDRKGRLLKMQSVTSVIGGSKERTQKKVVASPRDRP